MWKTRVHTFVRFFSRLRSSCQFIFIYVSGVRECIKNFVWLICCVLCVCTPWCQAVTYIVCGNFITVRGVEHMAYNIYMYKFGVVCVWLLLLLWSFARNRSRAHMDRETMYPITITCNFLWCGQANSDALKSSQIHTWILPADLLGDGLLAVWDSPPEASGAFSLFAIYTHVELISIRLDWFGFGLCATLFWA